VVFVVACGPFAGPVQLLTGAPQGDGCYTSGATGLLVVDALYGTAVVDEVMAKVTGSARGPIPVSWRPGFTGRHAGSEVEVLAPDGHVVAITGKRYVIEGGYAAVDGVDSFWSCGLVTPA
jgi:hypothetical protein